MEKFGVVKSGLTPEIEQAETKTAEDCVKSQIVDNNTQKVAALDDDFRKRAAVAVTAKLTK